MSGHKSRNIASSGRPVSSPTFSYGSRGPPCAAMTQFIVSTTRRTLSVSVPSRSQRTARSGLAATAARRAGDNRLGDGQRDLLRDPAIACFLADAHERCELVIQRVDVLEARVDDLEAEIRERVALDEAIDLVAGEAFRRGLPDRARELPAVELLAAAVALQHLDAR